MSLKGEINRIRKNLNMDPVWLLCAFGFGYLVKRIGLPPLVGFLAAGFVLKYFGVEQSALIDGIANFGVILLLFTIGLKLELKQLLKPQIWLTSSLHMAITIVLLSLTHMVGRDRWPGRFFRSCHRADPVDLVRVEFFEYDFRG